jgi:hypothetical protein
MATIPVIVDAVRTHGDLKQARCRYYTIASDEPVTSSFSLKTGQRFPFLLLGLTGIIFKPLGRAKRFAKAVQITELFEAVEHDGTLFVASDVVHLPLDGLTGSADGHGVRGMVYRIPIELFSLARNFTRGQISEENLTAACRDGAMRAVHSPSETNAFKAWSQLQIAAAREHYLGKPDRALRYDLGTTGGTP